jgi:hypothetical protein
MPGALDALKKYILGTEPAPGSDIELPLPAGHKRDPKLPKESNIRAGFRLMQDTMKGQP